MKTRAMHLLAAHYTVVAPTHPGFGQSDDAEWMDGIDDLAVVVLPAVLVLLGAAVVVNGEQHRLALARRLAEVDRGLPAVRADLDERSSRHVQPGLASGLEQREPFVGRHEALHRLGQHSEGGMHGGLR